LYGAVVKSFNDTHPAFGVANGPVDDQRYDDGSAHAPPTPPDDAVVVVVAPPDVGVGVVDVGGGLVGVGVPGLVHPNADSTVIPVTTIPTRRRDLGTLIVALIGR
jgi:hypothetical protein